MRINLVGPDGIVPTNISENGNGRYKVDFVPGVEGFTCHFLSNHLYYITECYCSKPGDYSMKMYYDDAPLEYFPINGTAVRFFINQQLPSQCPAPPPVPTSPPRKCSASGLGLSVAHLNEIAEFYVLSGSPSGRLKQKICFHSRVK